MNSRDAANYDATTTGMKDLYRLTFSRVKVISFTVGVTWEDLITAYRNKTEPVNLKKNKWI